MSVLQVSRNWVVATGVQGMAAGNSFQGQPSSLEYPILGYGLVRILGAGWLETTGRWKHLGKGVLIQADQPHGYDFHLVLTR